MSWTNQNAPRNQLSWHRVTAKVPYTLMLPFPFPSFYSVSLFDSVTLCTNSKENPNLTDTRRLYHSSSHFTSLLCFTYNLIYFIWIIMVLLIDLRVLCLLPCSFFFFSTQLFLMFGIGSCSWLIVCSRDWILALIQRFFVADSEDSCLW